MSTSKPLAEGEYLFTSESVTEGHPDKVADQISDGVLDAIMAEDPGGRVACETLVNTGMAVVSGEISTSVHLNVPEIVRETVRGIGYEGGGYGYDCDHISVIVSTVMPAMCGLAITLSMLSSGCSGSGGSFRNTSSPAPAICPARNAASSAASSWMPPRAVLTK